MNFATSSMLFALSFLTLGVCGLYMFPDELDKERYDEETYERMLDQGDVELERRRDYPETDESFWQEQDSESDGLKDVVISSSSGDLPGLIEINGIDFSNLPPNYHKTFTTGTGKNKMNVTIDKTTDPVTGEVSISVVESRNGHEISELNQCSDEKKCSKGKYCRKLIYGNFCDKCRAEKEACETNEGCCGTEGALCVRGICKTGYKKGEAGTICQSKDDCNSSMCCAKRFMKPHGWCQPLAKKGEKCAATKTEMSLIMHGGLCPCEKGFVCSSGSWLESFFGGSMNTLLGGNTCRIPGKKRKEGWSIFDDDEDEALLDALE